MSVEFNVLLFGPGLPSGGQATMCIVETDSIRLPLPKQLVPFSGLTARIGSFDHNRVTTGMAIPK